LENVAIGKVNINTDPLNSKADLSWDYTGKPSSFEVDW
jgi:hypothetical protein